MITLGVVYAVPKCDRRGRIGRIGTVLLSASLLALPACAGQDPESICPAAPCDRSDEDGGAGTDASTDASFFADAAGPTANDAGMGTAGESPSSEFDACFNGLDDDGDEQIDCDDVGCQASPYCCVGSSAAVCCAATPTSVAGEFEGCAGSDPSVCSNAGPFVAFGTPRPTLEGGAFLPNGDELGDSGLVLGPPMDPRSQRIRLSSRIAAPIDGCAGCLDVVALGLADPIDAAPEVRVVPDVAVMVRASRRDYALVVAGEVVFRAPLTDALPHTYILELAPDGEIRFLRDDETPVVARAGLLRAGRVPLLYGRTHNRDGASERARALDVSVASEGCDLPSAVTRDLAAVIPFDGVAWGERVVRSPSLLSDGGERLIAFGLDDDIHLARRTSTGQMRLAGSGLVESPVLRANAGEALRDPALFREDDRFVLYLTHVRADGSRTIARSVGASGHVESFDAPVDLALPADARNLESPSVVEWAGILRLAVRTYLDGEPVIALLNANTARPQGDAFVWAAGDLAGSIVARPTPDLTRFDRDEVSDPELVVDAEDLVRLYYAGRRGTRWSIGLLASADLRTFREPVVAGAVFEGTDRASHDSLWTREPSVLLVDGSLELFYTASDGVGMDIGRAVGVAP